MFKKLIIMIMMVMITSLAIAECPSGTYPCTINGQDGCCPRSGSDGVRGDVDEDFDGILLAYNSCYSRCEERYSSCTSSCYGYHGYNLPANHQTTCLNRCANSYTACMNTCN